MCCVFVNEFLLLLLFSSAEALDNHLTAVQHEHKIKSQIEERKIRSEEAQEEARRRERAHQEEKIRQEKARAEAEVCIYHLNIMFVILSLLSLINVFLFCFC